MPAISTLSDPERELVKKEIAMFLLGTDQRLIDRRALAEQLHALPLYSDMGGCILLEPTGQLVLVHSNQSYFGPVEVTSEIEPRYFARIALERGATRFPALASMLERLAASEPLEPAPNELSR
jgi:hypothetical protein